MEENKEMSFLDHLEELRWHLVRSTLCIFIFTIILFVFQKQVYNQFLLAHLQPDFNLSMVLRYFYATRFRKQFL